MKNLLLSLLFPFLGTVAIAQNFGIDQANPATKLHINYSSSGGMVGTVAYGGLHLDQDAGNDGYVGITSSATSSGTQAGILFQGSGSYGTKIHFLTTGSYAAGMSNKMTLDHLGNLGIGTTSPGQKLDVNGFIRSSQGFIFPDGAVVTKKPRVINTEDPVGGCPPARAANTDLFTQTFTLSNDAAVYISAAIIRNVAGRADLQLMVNGSQVDQTLTYTSAATWEDAYVQWTGNLGPGNHTVSLRSPSASVWGCGASWGSINTIIFE